MVDGELELMKSRARQVNKNVCLKRVRKGFREELASELAACGSIKQIVLLF